MKDLMIEHHVPSATLALVAAKDVRVGPSPASLREQCREASGRVSRAGSAGGEARRQAVRALLRSGGFKPSGRNKPAQEYLFRTVCENHDLPSINNAVDLINLVSLEAGLPISLLSLDRAGVRLRLRHGRSGECYVFNPAGQQLELEGLLVLCARRSGSDTPVGSPVKDSMEAKITAADRHLLACIYACESAIDSAELQTWLSRIAEGFREYCGASEVESRVLFG
jgi:DNA/RNA-binding domain of Phe-tRNA-synthetase-like protein